MLDGVDERYPARIDNVLRHADSRPDILAVGRSYKNADARRRGIFRLHDANLVVDEPQFSKARVEHLERFTQSAVERVDGAVAVRRRYPDSAVDAELYRRRCAVAVVIGQLVEHLVTDEIEERLIFSDEAVNYQLERRIRALILIALVFFLLQDIEQLRDLRRILVEIGIELLYLLEHRRLAGHFRKQEAPAVADGFGVDMLERFAEFQNAVGVHSSFMSKCAAPDKRHIPVQSYIGYRRYLYRRRCQIFEILLRDTLIVGFYLQIGDYRSELRVSAPLAEADKCALHLLRARSYRHECARARHVGVVVGVDSYICTRKGFYDLSGDFFYVIRERAAVCVAQSKAVRTAAQSRAQAFERVAVIVRHTVEEMLGIENDIFAVTFEKAAGFLYHRQIFFEARLQNALDLDFSALADY